MNKITLLNWQNQALKSWIKNNGKGVIQAPTGSGKTFVGLKLMQSDKLYPFLVVVPTLELKSQWIKRVMKYYPERGVIGVGGGDKLKSFSVDITVGIINSLRKEKLNFKTLIVDEIHHSTILAPVNYGIWSNIKSKYILGLSASPLSEQLSEEDAGWDIPLIFKYTLNNAYTDGVLLKPEIITKSVELEENEQEQYNELSEQIKSHSGSFEAFNDAPVWFKKWAFERNEILFNSKKKLNVLKNIINENEFKKCIVFTERIDSLNDIMSNLKDLGIECLYIHSGMKKKERMQVVSRFINTTFPTVLASVHIFEEGLDIPQIDLLVLYSYNSTKRQSTQRIGRALHNKDNVPKIYILYYKNTKESYASNKIKRIFEV